MYCAHCQAHRRLSKLSSIPGLVIFRANMHLGLLKCSVSRMPFLGLSQVGKQRVARLGVGDARRDAGQLVTGPNALILPTSTFAASCAQSGTEFTGTFSLHPRRSTTLTGGLLVKGANGTSQLGDLDMSSGISTERPRFPLAKSSARVGVARASLHPLLT
jgi:hypothetical protein